MKELHQHNTFYYLVLLLFQLKPQTYVLLSCIAALAGWAALTFDSMTS